MNWTKERQVVYCIEEVVDKHWMLGRFKVYGVVFRARLFRVDARSDHLVLVYLQHVTEEGTALVKQAEDAVSNKRVSLVGSLLIKFAAVYCTYLLMFVRFTTMPYINFVLLGSLRLRRKIQLEYKSR